MVKVKLIAFGQLAEILGDDELNLNAADTNGLKDALNQRFPELKNKKYVLAVNKQVVSINILLTEGATVALLPPFSGG
ncbi:MoaD/ThiS family protein [Pedobacter duraquae]|uniref:Molybdopterin synthase sulfur carrier subunit n=1 Tax=Pedobacter duraquae TaxID=425511 RepID=A0A4R6ID32_9SPHI|nr:MoaD/ThiS family protein [Pedobacter duraquae]TDO19566.1 molybdopterin synthase sulfur carrier subunit [Pedobacter duraquae]